MMSKNDSKLRPKATPRGVIKFTFPVVINLVNHLDRMGSAVLTSAEKIAAKHRLKQAVRGSSDRTLSMQGMLEYLFMLAFKGLVYPQIWEDPAVDMEALAITPKSRVVTIASGGCNVLSYLIADP